MISVWGARASRFIERYQTVLIICVARNRRAKYPVPKRPSELDRLEYCFSTAPVAQWIERWTSNPKAASSILAGGTFSAILTPWRDECLSLSNRVKEQYHRELTRLLGIEIITQGKETVPKRRFFTNVSVSVPQSKQDK